MTAQTRGKRRGFTLLEVMLVLLILGGLATLAVFTVGGRDKAAKGDMTGIRIKQLVGYLDQYKLRMGEYPTEEQGGLQALVTKPTFDDEKKGEKWYQFAKAEELKDAWDRDMKYELATDEAGNTVPRVTSSGADGEPDTADDIKSWTEETAAP